MTPPHIITVEDLKLLQSQISMAIGIIERNELYPMTEKERIQGERLYGRGAIVVGDFVITKRP